MKRILVLLVVLFSIGFSKDLTELGNEAYDKGDYQKAAELYQKACDSGEAFGCTSLGFLYENGQGVKQNFSTAKQYYGKACDLGLRLGCGDYRRLNEKGY
ncbi:tetratricopeptide repeat protein [uncultured Campylobacter sp.]|uniref:tetratricopeptide repeat protein n=1 Tax=uncultured Campylobacter sp. TaxID=218934 RepID=UPI0028ED7EAB|nr:tetratricopeptide repeat protein [uncultured Campylobacter sp.]